MKLSEAIKQITDQFGKDIITERRFLYMLADYYSFRDNPAEKHVISSIVNDGHSANLLISEINNVIVEKIRCDICRRYGFREDLVKDVVSSFVRGLNISNPDKQDGTIISNSIIDTDKEITAISTQNNHLFFLKQTMMWKNDEVVVCDAVGHYNDNDGSFVIHKGSLLSIQDNKQSGIGSLVVLEDNIMQIKYIKKKKRFKTIRSFNMNAYHIRKNILTNSCKLQHPFYYLVEKDILCVTPSEAAFVATGFNANGMTCWKDNNGRTLKDYLVCRN